MLPLKKKKKVDYEALNSPLMRIPRMDSATSRATSSTSALVKSTSCKGARPRCCSRRHELKNQDMPDDRMRYFRMAVYYAETAEPDHAKMHPDEWN